MDYILAGTIIFITAVILTALFFLTKRAEVENIDPLKQLGFLVSGLISRADKNDQKLEQLDRAYTKEFEKLRREIVARDEILRSEHLDLRARVSDLSPYHRVVVQMPKAKKKSGISA